MPPPPPPPHPPLPPPPPPPPSAEEAGSLPLRAPPVAAGALTASGGGRQVTVELKNDLVITGVLHSVDQYLNIKLNGVQVVEEEKYPHLMAVKNCFVRGSVVRYIQIPPAAIDVDILHDATRREARGA